MCYDKYDMIYVARSGADVVKSPFENHVLAFLWRMNIIFTRINVFIQKIIPVKKRLTCENIKVDRNKFWQKFTFTWPVASWSTHYFALFSTNIV